MKDLTGKCTGSCRSTRLGSQNVHFRSFQPPQSTTDMARPCGCHERTKCHDYTAVLEIHCTCTLVGYAC